MKLTDKVLHHDQYDAIKLINRHKLAVENSKEFMQRLSTFQAKYWIKEADRCVTEFNQLIEKKVTYDRMDKQLQRNYERWVRS